MNKKTPIILLLALFLVGGVSVYLMITRGSNEFVGTPIVDTSGVSTPTNTTSVKSDATSPKNATFTIEGQPVTLVNGTASTPAAPGSASMITTQYFGNEVIHDFDGDGRPDSAFILTQNTGGTGTFYYLVIALNTPRGYIGSSGYLLGDRIAPQTTEMSQNANTPDVLVVNYADRKISEPFSVAPSVGKSVWLKLDLKTMQFGEVAQNFEGESR